MAQDRRVLAGPLSGAATKLSRGRGRDVRARWREPHGVALRVALLSRDGDGDTIQRSGVSYEASTVT